MFSLGIVLYELLTGTRLFQRDNDFDDDERDRQRRRSPPPSAQPPRLPPALDEIVMTALAQGAGAAVPDRGRDARGARGASRAATARAVDDGARPVHARAVRRAPEPWIELDAARRAAERGHGDQRARRAIGARARHVARHRSAATRRRSRPSSRGWSRCAPTSRPRRPASTTPRCRARAASGRSAIPTTNGRTADRPRRDAAGCDRRPRGDPRRGAGRDRARERAHRGPDRAARRGGAAADHGCTRSAIDGWRSRCR